MIERIRGMRVQGVDTGNLHSKSGGGEDQGQDVQPGSRHFKGPRLTKLVESDGPDHNPKLQNQVRERIKAKTHNTQKKALRKKVTDY